MLFAASTSAADPRYGNTSRRDNSNADRNVRSTERVARASWQPSRRDDAGDNNADESQLEETTVKLVGYEDETRDRARQAKTRRANQQRVRQVAANNAPLPPASSIIDPPVQHGHLDGQIPMGYGSGTPIHGLPSYDSDVVYGDGSCDSMGCGGGCDSGCDSMSCGGCGTSGCSMCGELASPNAWRPCLTLCVPQDGWVSFEYLTWWQDGMDLPPLVTSSVGPNVPATQAGVLGQATTRILFGGDDVLTDNFDGGRLRFGVWLDKCHTWGLGAEYFNIGSESEGISRTSTGNPTLSRPFFNTETNQEDAQIVAFPGILTGTVRATATSELTGAGVHLRHLRNCCEGCSSGLFCGCAGHFCSRTEAIFGYRGLQLKESVTIHEDLVSNDPSNPGSFDIMDRFETRNQFNGFDIGWLNRRTRGFWSLDTSLRLAIGNNKQTVRVNGSTEITDPSATPSVQTFEGGLLTQNPGNIGVFERNEFAVVPEIGATLGYQLTDHLRATLGYTFIYWSNMVRPGDHIDRDVNPNLIPPQVPPIAGAARPGFEFDTTDYWVQGLSFGGEYRW
ncbi:BBP7 family outer membrane beta-barrel protein [Rubripirellula obstinata]|uniref:BBP7 family outer membrane beta-barrel protein n=1 Tax=Rubripirellula obstinata TaxID=406547 RepID=UPI0013901347|nr:BBP7 family outer membrane beta-barrel protein [Rubripirellula obstinata]